MLPQVYITYPCSWNQLPLTSAKISREDRAKSAFTQLAGCCEESLVERDGPLAGCGSADQNSEGLTGSGPAAGSL